MPYVSKKDRRAKDEILSEKEKSIDMAKRKQFKNSSLKPYSKDYDPVLAKRREKEKARRKANTRRMKRGY